jgi:Ribonuclease G/E
MKRILAFLFLIPTLVLGEWSEGNIHGDHKYYIDLKSISRLDASTVKYEMKKNYFKPEKGALSSLGLIEMNCSRKEWKLIHYQAYSNNDLQGKLIYSKKLNLVSPILNLSREEKIASSLCDNWIQK